MEKSVENSRTFNSIRNIKFGVITQILNVILSFGMRFALIQIFGREILGISATFSSILTVLSLSEIGIGEAISFLLYKPLAQKDYLTVKRIILFLKRIYYFIFCFICIFGIGCSFFLKYIIGDSINIPNIYIYYFLYVANSACGFVFGGFKRILLSSDQKNYIISFISSLCSLFFHLLSLIFLIVTKNFICYLIGQLLITIFSNIFCSIFTNKKYPFLKIQTNIGLTIEEKKKLRKNVFALLIQKVNGVVIQSIDVLLLTTMFSVSMSGVYSNYSLVIGQVTTFASLCFNVSMSSVGNMLATKDLSYSKKIYKKTQYITLFVYTICSCCLIGLMKDTILILADRTYLFSTSTLIILVLNFYLFGIRNNIITYKNALGLYWETKWLPLICAILNILLSILLGKFLGLIGIFIATTIVYLVMILRENYVLEKHGFKNTNFSSVKFIVKNLISFTMCVLPILCFRNFEIINPFVDIIVKLFICICLSAFNIELFNNNKDGNDFLKSLLGKVLKR